MLNMPETASLLNAPIQLVQNETGPDIVLVIPCYGYASFLPEFMSGILAQRGGVAFRCLLVDDSDPDTEMFITAQTYSAAYPDFIHYLRPRHNRGLSAARNAGAEYAMAVWPTADVIMFPDGDDRLSNDFVAVSYEAFRHEEARARDAGLKLGWVFEHPVIVGINGEMPRITSHSQLWNLIGATQMPSSAMSMQMFRDGLRYDETLRWAGEDWDFSVLALAAGYVGQHCERQGFLWRRRPGSMSAAHAATMARAHNSTLIRLKNKPTFTFQSIAALIGQENPHYCTFTRDDITVHSVFQDVFSPADGSTKADGEKFELTHKQLARTIHNNINLPADPCPQTFTFAPNGLPAALGGSHLHQYFALLNDFYAGQGFVLCHQFRQHDGDAGIANLHGTGHKRPHHSDVISMSLEQVITLVNDPRLESTKFLNLEWSIPRLPEDKPMPRTGAFTFALDKITDLRQAGYHFAYAQRFGRQKWQPNGLTWRKLPGHLLGSSGFYPTADLKNASLVICNATDVPNVVAALKTTQKQADLMVFNTLMPHQETALSDGLAAGAVDQIYPADAVLLGAGASKNFSQNDLLIPLLSHYGTAVFWRNMRFSNHLALIKKSGVHREIVFASARDVFTVLSNISSAFKCYDTYRVLRDDDHKAHSILNVFGVPNEFIKIGLFPCA